MQRRQASAPRATVHANNIGGIQETEVTIEPGVTILVGRNATNRTSFLQAIMAALGSENVAMKGDADNAEVTLELGEETYTRTFTRREGGIERGGDPYLDDPELADLFAFLLESNEARRAVTTNADLRELIMRPVDTEEVQAEIDRLQDHRDDLEGELATIDDRKGELRGLEDRRETLRGKIEETKAELEATEDELDAADADVEARQEEQSELEDRLEELHEKRADLEDVRYELETEQESLQALKTERREYESELEDLDEKPDADADEIETQLRELRERKSELESQVNELQSVIRFNEGMLDEDGPAAPIDLDAGGDGALTDQLVDDAVTCWTCGTAVDPDQIESTLEQLRDRSQSKVSEVDRLEREIEQLRSEKREIEQVQTERERLEHRLDELETEIRQTEATIDDLRDRREQLTESIEEVEAAVDELEGEEYDEVLELHRNANELEYELGRLEGELEDLESTIAEAEARIEEEDDIRAELDDVNEDIERLRTRIDRIEREAVKAFNDHMGSLLDRLEYENLDRIWIERVEREVREGRHKVTERAFELHVVRTTDSGAAYEDTVDHLSESEREVTGLVFALAGYLVHDVSETVPFMLLDSLEAIDARRIAALVDYFSTHARYVVVALLPEDAAVLDDEYERITEI
ncbi:MULTISPECIES: archaea-specific SMC-related protein [Halolamina]|uniref:AAA ATPase domain-containing protein n=1 Tax=Halolamina pelagica TaxID=699431 RepID=A0A1I5T433_9EURY|nr:MULTISPECIES: archaea-specific SMC-related protein [Halolamina]NHX37466.1 AAA family ATPase [Halolamina sp. R1-12]SFP77718.1 AAA ATPase domain-containing protein [Halolamina pelagica]